MSRRLFYRSHLDVTFWDRHIRSCLTSLLLFWTLSFATSLEHHGGAFGQDSQPSHAASLRDLNGHFPMTVPKSLAQWQARADAIRLQVGVATATHPKPKLASLDAVTHGRRELDGYSIEKMYFESLPGLFVTGSLYRPHGKSNAGERRPAVLYAHGHWEDGRFYAATNEDVKELLATGAERFESAAVNMLQAACVQLARMGCVVFQYDMLGYADSQQISFDRAHRYGLKGPNEQTTADGWPLYSAMAEGYGQSVMAIQTINTQRAIEVIGSLEDVDPAKMVITGASGGGTQSFIAAAIEPRLAGAFPAVMVSTGMQGGCTCENACGLRVGTGNVEITATIAPRSLGLTAADDWTKSMPNDGFPELKELYGLFGKASEVELNAFTHFPHNYNHVSRTAMYGWVNRVFDLGFEEPILERDFRLLGRNELTVWDANHPSPPSGIDFERRLLQNWASDTRDSIKLKDGIENVPDDAVLQYLREGWTTILSPALEVASSIDIAPEKTSTPTQVARSPSGKVVSKWKATDSQVVIVLGAVLAEPQEERNVWTVESIDDVFDSTSGEQCLVDEPRRSASYTYGYNAPQLVRRLGVLLAGFDSATASSNTKVRLSTDLENTFLAAGLAMMRSERIQSISIRAAETDLTGFCSRAASITDPNFVPHSLRYGDLPGLIRAVEAAGVKVAFSK